MSERAKALRGRGLRTIKSKLLTMPDGSPVEYTFRKLNNMELVRVGMLGILQTPGIQKIVDARLGTERAAAEAFANPETAPLLADVMHKVIELAMVDPKVSTAADVGSVPDDAVHVTDIAEDAEVLFMEIMSFANLGQTAADAMEELLKKRASSESSTASEGVTENFPTN